MASYVFVKSILDVPALVAYVAKTLSQVQSASIDDGLNLTIHFSAALSAGQQQTLSSLIQAYADPTLAAYDSLNLLLYNYSTAALGANGTYTGLWEDVSQYSSIVVFALCSSASATAGLQLQFGFSKAQMDLVRSYSVAAETPLALTLSNPGKYFRLVYNCGSQAAVHVALQVRTSGAQLAASSGGGTSTTTPAADDATLQLELGRLDIGTYVALRADEGRRLRVRTAADSALSSSTHTVPLVQISFAYSVNAETVNTLTTGAATVAQSDGVALLQSNGTGTAYLVSRRYVLSSAGTVARALFATTFSGGVSGSVQLVGVGNDRDGLFIGYRDTQFGVMLRRGGIDTWSTSSAFTVDKMDGTGPSGSVLDPSSGNVYQIVYDSMGYGGATFSLCSTSAALLPEPVSMHRIAFSAGGCVRLHSLPLIASVQSSASAVTLRVASLCAYGDGMPTSLGRVHSIDASRSLASTTVKYIPLLSINNVSTYQSVANTVALLLRSLSLSTTGGDGNVIFALYEGAVLQNDAFAAVSSDKSVAECDTSATAFTGGTLLYTQCLTSDSDSCTDLTQQDIQIGAGMKITVACKLASSTSSAVISACLTWREDA